MQDDFWNLFLTCWIIGFTIISQFVYYFSPGLQPVSVYSCMHYFPTESLEPKTRLSAIMVSVVSFAIMAFTLSRIEVLKRKIKNEMVTIITS